MSKVSEVIEALLQQSDEISTRQVAALAGVSRQGAQKQLKALVELGRLTVHGHARAARYKKPDRVQALWAKVAQLSQALQPAPEPLHAQARFGLPRLQRQVLEVASAGSLFRLSARLLLSEVVPEATSVVLDFTGVVDVGDEFLEEIFQRWAIDHGAVRLSTENVAPGLQPKVAGYAPVAYRG
jgi:hypothetical protein